MNRSSTAGFTLTEMLAVLAIVMMLIAIIVPALQGSRDAANIAKCAMHLQSLSQAYLQRAVDTPVHQRATAGIISDPFTWPSALDPYMEGRSAVHCPADGTIGSLWGGDDPSSPGYDGFAEAPGYDYHHIHPDGTFSIPMSNASFMVNSRGWNETSEGDFRWRQYYGASPPLGQALIFAVDRPEHYFSLQGADADRTFTRNEHSFSFVPIEGEQIDGIGWKIYDYGSFQRSFRYNGQSITTQLPGYGNRVRHRAIPVTAWDEASYGINNRVAALRGETRILLIDYERIVADVVGPDAADIWGQQMDDIAGRHRGSLNVLTSDGAVELRHPDEIDPGIPHLHDTRWKPDRDVALDE